LGILVSRELVGWSQAREKEGLKCGVKRGMIKRKQQENSRRGWEAHRKR